MYEIIRQSDEKTWYVESPCFVRNNSNNELMLSIESNAHGVWLDGTVYHILGRAEMQGCDEVLLGENSEEAYSNVQMTKLLDEHTNIFADNDELMLDHEERLILLEVGE